MRTILPTLARALALATLVLVTGHGQVPQQPRQWNQASKTAAPPASTPAAAPAAAPAPAATPELAAPERATIVVANLAPVPRKAGWTTLVLPNDACPKPPLEVAGHSWLALYGEPWGPRARLVHIRYTDLGPFEQAQVEIVSGKGPTPESGPASVAAAILDTGYLPRLVVRIGERTEKVLLLPRDPVESLHRTCLHGSARIPGTMLVAQFWYYIYPGSRSVGFELVVCNSDPSTYAFIQGVDAIAVETPQSIVPIFDYHIRRGGKQTMPAGGGLVTPLIDSPTWLGDGQALAWRGRILLIHGAAPDDLDMLFPELRDPVTSMALPKHWQGSWGPWGELPKLHPVESTAARGYGQRAVIELYQRFASKAGRPDGHPSGAIFAEADWGNGWRPPQAGDHEDFGVTGGAPALSPPSGGPSHLFDVGHAVLYEWLRPSYNYEADGNPLRPQEHPQTLFWGLHNHWHTGASPDRLGKPLVGADDSNAVQFQDWAHMSLNSIYAWCQLTGSHMGRQLLHQIESGWLLGSRVTQGLSEPRGWGRTMMAMAWSWCVTGDQRIVERLRARWQVNFDEHLARKNDSVAAFGIYPPDPRQLDGRYPFLFGWQEGLALNGMDAAYWLCYVANTDSDVGKDKARESLMALSRTLIEHYWWFYKGRWTLAYAMRYDQGRALDPSAYSDPSQVAPHWPGTGVDKDGGGSLVIARRWCKELGRQDLVDKATTILDSLTSWYESASGQDRPFTRWSTWAATR